MNIYAEFLGDIDANAGAKAVAQIIQTSRFFPSIAQIREVSQAFKPNNRTPMPKWLSEPQPMSNEEQAKEMKKLREMIESLARKKEYR